MQHTKIRVNPSTQFTHFRSQVSPQWKAELSTISSNRFSPLDNLKVNREDEVNTVKNRENIFTSSTLKNAIKLVATKFP